MNATAGAEMERLLAIIENPKLKRSEKKRAAEALYTLTKGIVAEIEGLDPETVEIIGIDDEGHLVTAGRKKS